jgi:hypothetical protein
MTRILRAIMAATHTRLIRDMMKNGFLLKTLRRASKTATKAIGSTGRRLWLGFGTEILRLLLQSLTCAVERRKGVDEMRKIAMVLIGCVACLGLVTGALAGKRSTADEMTQERINRSTVSPVPKAEEVTTGNVRWNVLNVEEIGPVLIQEYTGATLETKGKFVNIRFEVVNLGDRPKYIFNLRLVDDRGRTYPICAAAYAYLGAQNACMMAELLPDVKRSFVMYHDIPLNAHDLWLEVTDLNVPSKEKKYIDLGV